VPDTIEIAVEIPGLAKTLDPITLSAPVYLPTPPLQTEFVASYVFKHTTQVAPDAFPVSPLDTPAG
jgi:hypothetical protein